MAAAQSRVQVTIGAALAGNFQQVFQSADARINGLGRSVSDLSGRIGQIGDYGRMIESTRQAGAAWQAARQRVRDLRDALAATPAPTDAQRQAIDRAAQAHKTATRTVVDHRAALRLVNQEIRAATGPVDELRTRQQQLREALTGAIARQQESRQALAGLRAETAQNATAHTRLSGELRRAEAAAGTALAAMQRHRTELASARAALTAAGVDTRNLAAEHDRLSAALARNEARYRALRGVQERQQGNMARRADMRGQLVDAAALGTAAYIPIGGALKAGAEFQYQLRLIGNTADMTDAEIASLGATIKQTSKDTLQSAENTQKAMGFLIAAGMNTRTAVGMLQPIGMAATAFGAEIEDISKAAFTLNDSLKIDPSQMVFGLGILAAAGKQGNVELRDMAKELPVLGSGFTALKMSGAEAAATMGAALQIARKGAADASQAANNMQDFIAKIMSPETLKKAQKGFGVDLYAVIQAAQKAGKNPMDEAIKVIAKMTKGGDQKLIGELFGDRQVQNFIRPMIQYWDEYEKIKAQALATGGDVIARDFQTVGATAKVQFQQIENAAGRLKIALGEALLPQGAAIFAPVIDQVATLVERYPVFTRAVVYSVAALIGAKVAAVAYGYAMTFVRGAMLATQAQWLLMPLRLSAMSIWMTATAASARAMGAAMWASASGGVAALGSAMVSAFAALRAAPFLALASGAQIAFTAVVTGARAMALALIANPVGAAIAGIAVAGFLVWKYWQPIGAFFGGMWDGFVQGTAGARDALAPLAPIGQAIMSVFGAIGGVISGVIGWFGQMLSPASYTEQQLNRVSDAGTNLGRTIGAAISALVTVFVSLPMTIGAALGALYTQMMTIGGQIIDGMIAGIRSRIEGLKAVAVEAAGAIPSWFKEKLGIKSPSRVMMELGGHTADGLRVGLEAGAGSVLSTMAAVVAGLTAPIAAPVMAAPVTAPIAALNFPTPAALPDVFGAIQRQVGEGPPDAARLGVSIVRHLLSLPTDAASTLPPAATPPYVMAREAAPMMRIDTPADPSGDGMGAGKPGRSSGGGGSGNGGGVYHITINASSSPQSPEDIARAVRAEIERMEWENRSRGRSSLYDVPGY